MSDNKAIKKSKYSTLLLFSCLFPIIVHKMKSSNEHNNIHQTNDKNINVIIMQFIDYLHEIIQDNHDFISFKQYITNIMGEEIKKAIQDNISSIIFEHQEIIKMKQIIIDKQTHIEQLELMIYELQALLRTKDENIIVEKDLNNNQSYNIKNIPTNDQISISFKNKITNFFTTTHKNKIIESGDSIQKINSSVESESVGNTIDNFHLSK